MPRSRDDQDETRLPLKAVMWEEAKGKLRALVALQGSYKSYEMGETEGAKVRTRFDEAGKAVEDFIAHFEAHALHE